MTNTVLPAPDRGSTTASNKTRLIHSKLQLSTCSRAKKGAEEGRPQENFSTYHKSLPLPTRLARLRLCLSLTITWRPSEVPLLYTTTTLTTSTTFAMEDIRSVSAMSVQHPQMSMDDRRSSSDAAANLANSTGFRRCVDPSQTVTRLTDTAGTDRGRRGHAR